MINNFSFIPGKSLISYSYTIIKSMLEISTVCKPAIQILGSCILAITLTGCSTGGQLGAVFSYKEDDIEVQCSVFNSIVPWRYCVTKHKNSGSSEVVYFFHEGSGSEKSWSSPNNLGQAVRNVWRTNKAYSMPVVVSVTAGKSWFLTSGKYRATNNVHSGLLDDFLSRVIPHIEGTVLKRQPTARHALGLSMGAFNAGQVFFQNVYNFRSLALICPALHIPERQKHETIEAFALRIGAKETYIRRLLKTAKDISANKAVQARHSVLNLARNAETQGKSIYLSCGTKDEFGFYASTVQLYNILKDRRKTYTQFKPIKGGHCIVDDKTLAIFYSEMNKHHSTL